MPDASGAPLRLGIVTGLTAEARLVRSLGPTRAAGTPAGARAAARELLAEGVDALLSFGLAGGLDPVLTPGALVVPLAVREGAATMLCDPGLVAWLGGATTELLLSEAAVLWRPADKASRFAATGAAAVDLESGAVAQTARHAGRPFAVLRSICDPADCGLPPAALVAMDSSGAIGFGRVAASLVRRPGQLPALLTLARNAAMARASLVRRVDDLGRGLRLVGQF